LSTGIVFHGQLVAQNEEIEHFQVTSGAEANERSAGAKTHTTPFSCYVNFISKQYFLHYEVPLFRSCTCCSAVTEFNVSPSAFIANPSEVFYSTEKQRCTF